MENNIKQFEIKKLDNFLKKGKYNFLSERPEKNNNEFYYLTSSKASSISNLATQKVESIKRKLESIGLYSKYMGDLMYILKTNKLEVETIKSHLKSIGELNTVVGFMMENIKLKDSIYNSYSQTLKNDLNAFSKEQRHLIDEEKNIKFSKLENNHSYDQTSFGWNSLSEHELVEYLYNENMSASIGKFIHKGGKLDLLRKDISNIPSVDFIELEVGKKTPLTIEKNYEEDVLDDLHAYLSKLHNEYESKVNYIKSKVNNKETEENNTINKAKSEILNEYTKNVDLLNNLINEISTNINNELINASQKINKMVIKVPKRIFVLLESYELLSKDNN